MELFRRYTARFDKFFPQNPLLKSRGIYPASSYLNPVGSRGILASLVMYYDLFSKIWMNLCDKKENYLFCTHKIQKIEDFKSF